MALLVPVLPRALPSSAPSPPQPGGRLCPGTGGSPLEHPLTPRLSEPPGRGGHLPSPAPSMAPPGSPETTARKAFVAELGAVMSGC